MKNFAFTILFFLNYQWAGAQEREILGRLIDKETQKPISNANVVVPGTLIGVASNVLGYFRLSVRQNHNALAVSRIGYKTSVIELGANDKFQVKIERGVIELDPLDFASFQPTTKLFADTTTRIVIPGLTEKDAQYSGGWTQFYNDVFRILNSDSVTRSIGDSLVHLHFTIQSNGEFTLTKTDPDVGIIMELMKTSQNFSLWKSARQNGVAVSQDFKMALTNERIDTVLTVVEESAMPVGGLPAFYRFLGNTMNYPVQARRGGVQGEVFVQFIVEKDGTITNSKIIKRIGGGCDEEVLRVMEQAPKWNPGRQKGKSVRQRYTLPIIFKIG
ncbi:MAG: TonB family protein [Cyclobacteriaceae bacterium]